MSRNKKSVTFNCRYMDTRRRVTLPAAVLERAGIPLGTMLDCEAINGCVLIRPVVGITVPDHTSQGALIKKGR